MHTRRARLPDAENIHRLISSLSADGTLLPRPFAEICENVRDFQVTESSKGEFLGCGALHLYGPHLAEIRSIVVHKQAQHRGVGSQLIQALLREAAEHGVGCVCLFTRNPDFFARHGFEAVARTAIPDKIYKDCQRCPRLYACDEVAMARGKVPDMAILGPSVIDEELVQLHN